MLTAALLCGLRNRGIPVAPWKPVETGVADGAGEGSDGQFLAALSGAGAIAEVVGVCLPEPLAPVVAARRAGVDLHLGLLEARRPEGPLIIEGAGGVLVELCPGWTAADLAARWDFRVVVVAANRLGALNHTLLTLEALSARGVPVLAVVLNTVREGAPSLAEEENLPELRRLLGVGVPVLESPWIPASGRWESATLAQHAENHLAVLLSSFDGP